MSEEPRLTNTDIHRLKRIVILRIEQSEAKRDAKKQELVAAQLDVQEAFDALYPLNRILNHRINEDEDMGVQS